MFSNIVSLSEKHGFLSKIHVPRVNIEQLQYGPIGLLLKENLRSEWFNNLVINKDVNVFLTGEKCFAEAYNFAKKISQETLPFGIAEIKKSNKKSSEDLISYYENRMRNKEVDFSNMFDLSNQVVLRCTVFTSASESTQFFHQWQRQRRIWWRKCSPNPGLYKLTDIKNCDNGQSVDMLAEYPWNPQRLETITVHHSHRNLNKEELQFKEGKKNIEAHNIVSEVDVTTMFLNTLCDAYDESVIKDKKRTLFRFHRKLAPYKISFAVSASSSPLLSELKELATYLTTQLRTNHVATLFISGSKLTLDAQYQHFDQLGIPYNVLLKESTLKDGVAFLRSRDTTLKEQVHVADLVNYVEQLFKNY